LFAERPLSRPNTAPIPTKQAIYGGIEAADTFAFALTLNSIVSVPWGREIADAMN
jgi:hypothetical protein